jgi:phosphatidate cytidylyltransferase
MINLELQKRILTSLVLILLLFLIFLYTYILIISLTIIVLICWIEFYGLILKIFNKKNLRNKMFRFICRSLSLLYLISFSILFFVLITRGMESKNFLIYSILITINSDIGGLVFGKIFKGRKLTKISPKKTISGSIGSFIFSLALVPYFLQYISNINIISIIMITLIISLAAQMGDLFISFLKRKAQVKDTGNLLPGHGGFLDRIDGLLFAIPISFLLFSF